MNCSPFALSKRPVYVLLGNYCTLLCGWLWHFKTFQISLFTSLGNEVSMNRGYFASFCAKAHYPSPTLMSEHRRSAKRGAHEQRSSF